MDLMRNLDVRSYEEPEATTSGLLALLLVTIKLRTEQRASRLERFAIGRDQKNIFSRRGLIREHEPSPEAKQSYDLCPCARQVEPLSEKSVTGE